MLLTFDEAGREPDATGLVHYRARYYDPAIGRFTQRDPLGFIDGVNRCAYALNDPVNRRDPIGQIDTEGVAKEFGEPIGAVLYLVEGSAGEAIEIPERFLVAF